MTTVKNLTKKELDSAFNWSMYNLDTELSKAYVAACDCVSIMHNQSKTKTRSKSKMADMYKTSLDLAIDNRDALCRIVLTQL